MTPKIHGYYQWSNCCGYGVILSDCGEQAKLVMNSEDCDVTDWLDIDYVLEYAKEKNTEVIGTGEEYVSGAKKGQEKTTQGSLYGKLTNFVNRLENKINDNRLDFLLAQKSKDITFEETLNQLIGYQTGNQSNVTVIDLSGVPFEVLSITVSLISRMVSE